MAGRVDPAIPGDIDALLPFLSEPDRQEILALGTRPEIALPYTLRTSVEAWTGSIDGEILCVFGVSETNALCPVYRPWMVGANYLSEHRRTFIPASAKIVQGWAERYQFLENFVDTRHKVAVRWLSWLGFTIDPPQAFGPYQRPFHRFHMGTPDVY